MSQKRTADEANLESVVLGSPTSGRKDDLTPGGSMGPTPGSSKARKDSADSDYGHALRTEAGEQTHILGEPLLPRASQDHLPDLPSGHDLMGQDLDSELLKLGRSPININNLVYYLDFYPNEPDAKILKDGFIHGFRLQYTGSSICNEVKNLKSASLHPQELNKKIQKEVSLGRMIGPFYKPPFDNLKISPVGLVPKSDGTWRLITHLSYPHGSSVNDGIDSGVCSVSYTTFDKISQMIFSLGKDSLMAKRDIKSAFRLLPVHPEDFYLLGIKIEDRYYIDRMLPMGLSLSCALFEKFSTFLHWLVDKKSNIHSLDHYLDDFILAGEKNSSNCENLIQSLTTIFDDIGVPIAEEKSVGPTTVLTFLGLELDSKTMTIRIPLEKIEDLLESVKVISLRKKVTLKELQRLVGKLCFVCRAIQSSRAFLRRFYDAMSSLKQPFHRLRVSNELKADLKMWSIFLSKCNGIAHIPAEEWVSSKCLNLYTDSAGSAGLGCGCFYDGKWSYFQWPKAWIGADLLSDITFLEMVPVVLALYLWGNDLACRKILLHIDNEALVTVINKQSAKSKRLMKLVRVFVLLSMELEICFKAVHISSKNNGIADAISRMQWTRFKSLAPEAADQPDPVPEQFLSMISEMRLND